MLGNNKNVFWEALLLTIVVFALGMLLGIGFEAKKADIVNKYYAKSEISLMDILALNDLIELKDIDCNTLTNANIKFADKIYEEAAELEKYEASGRITENIKIAHHKYDLLRTFLWINNVKTLEKCKGNYSLVVYLYEYNSEDLTKRATQSIWSKILFDLKKEKGEEIILIPIARDSNLTSLDSLVEKFEITEFPAVIINQKHVIQELTSVTELEKYLN